MGSGTVQKNKRTSSCPGGHLPKAEHGFGAMHKNCNGPDVSDSENSMDEIRRRCLVALRQSQSLHQVRPMPSFSRQ